jgi:hypothetical protein
VILRKHVVFLDVSEVVYKRIVVHKMIAVGSKRRAVKWVSVV